MSYNPKPETAEWLNWALEKAQSIPYTPTARWVFYRLVQEWGFSKGDYKSKFLPTTSKARKNFWNGWDPLSFADDTRKILNKFGEYDYKDAYSWFEGMLGEKPFLDLIENQPNIVFVCFEADAMVGQFKHYLNKYRVPLCAFKGDASVPYKYEIAQAITEIKQTYPEKEIYVLYFGDYDPKGLEIPENAMRDIRRWAGCKIEYIRCGINAEHIDQYNITDSPENPDKYQWEALDDSSAGELIVDSVLEYWDADRLKEVHEQETNAGELWSEHVDPAIYEVMDMLVGNDDKDEDEDDDDEEVE